MRRVLLVVGFIAGLYLVGRAIAEFFTTDFQHPDRYRLDWGGPSLAGVLAVHCGPGVISAVLMGWWVVRRRRRAGARAAGAATAADPPSPPAGRS